MIDAVIRGIRSHRSLIAPVMGCVVVLAAIGWIAGHAATEWDKPEAADENYNLLVRGFRSGQLSLQKEVPASFRSLPDPFDPAINARFRYTPDWLHDLSYYRGKLYLYFGASPAVLLFGPWNLITGHYLPHRVGVAAFCAAGFLAAAGTFLWLWRRYFADVSPVTATAAVLTLGLGTGIPILLQRAQFWEVAISCGSALTLISVSAVVFSLADAGRRVPWLATASLAYGLAIGARPNVLFGAVILLIPLLQDRRPKLWLAALGPLAICGLALATYNALRFGSPFQFGEKYQLAADRQDAAGHFSLNYLWFNFRAYFINPVRWRLLFPFVEEVPLSAVPRGHAPFDDALGILPNLPFLALAALAPLALRGRTGEERGTLAGALTGTALLFVTSAIVLFLFYGTCWRYETELIAPLGLLSAIGLLALERTTAGLGAWQITARAGWSVLVAISIAFSLFGAVGRRADQLAGLGRFMLDTGRTAEAEAKLRDALQLKPWLADANANLGFLLSRAGKSSEALACYERAFALSSDPASGRLVRERNRNVAEAHCALAENLARLPGRAVDSIAQYERALRLKPDFATARVNLARVLATLPGRREEAIAHCEEVVRVNPEAENARELLSLLRATDASGSTAISRTP